MLQDKNSRKKFYHINSFSFKDKTKEEVLEEMNDELPVNLRGNSDLIQRVCAKYPLLPKADVVLVCNHTFSAIRDLLVLGKIINFTKNFFQTKLHFFKSKSPKKIDIIKLKVQVSTPVRIRKS